MKHLPVYLNMKNQLAVVVGGGPVAARKIRLLRESGARVRLVSPELCPALEKLIERENTNSRQSIEHIAEPYTPRIIEPGVEAGAESVRLIVAATNDAPTNLAIATLATNLNIPCNVADNPDAGSFVLPSVVDRDPILVAISSGGTSPILARLLKARIEAFIPESYRQLAILAGEFREAIKERLKTPNDRKLFWEKVLHGRVAELMFSGHPEQARAALLETMESTAAAADQGIDDHAAPASLTTGEVYLVGAGPGDPDLLTLRALRLIQSADVLVYDRLVSQRIIDLRGPTCELLYAGKAKSDHAMPQGSINELLVTLARDGKRVVRLKGGDPFIFGRGGEEIETLAKNEIPFQVVPGITAASGCAAFSGIPLTHRDHAQSCVFVTGHLKNGEINLNWEYLRDPHQSIVIYMGLTGLSIICEKLIGVGRSAETPAALVEQGTTPNQRVHTGTLQSLPGLISSRKVRAPTLLIVGSVVALHDSLKWFQADPPDERSTESWFSSHSENP